MVPIVTLILRSLVASTLLAIFLGSLLTWAWVIRRTWEDGALPRPSPIVERRRTPWGAGTLLLILLSYVLVSYLVSATLHRGEPVPPAGAGRQEISPLQLMGLQGAINAVLIVALPALARLTSGTRLRDLGLTRREWPRQAAVGIVAVLFLMPVVYTVQAVCVSYLDMPDDQRELHKHPLEKMLRDHFSPGVAATAFLTAVVLAPVFEELLFRGFLQGWLVAIFDRLAAAFRPEVKPEDPPLDELFDPDLDAEPPPADPASDLVFWEAAAASESLDPSMVAACEPMDDGQRTTDNGRRSPRATTAAIVLTSMLFAVAHAPQWPAPIPLFLLALGLGVVYQRTGSLLAPICMHAVFNGFSTLLLFFVVLHEPVGKEGKPEARPILERPAPLEEAGAPAPKLDPATITRPADRKYREKTPIADGISWTPALRTATVLEVVQWSPKCHPYRP